MYTHRELCEITAKWAITPPAADWLALWEYQSFASEEFPDVLTFYAHKTTLYEIKTSHSDFLADQRKTPRVLHGYKRLYSGLLTHTSELRTEAQRKQGATYIDRKYARRLDALEARIHYWGTADRSFKQWPHLGQYRYYVCEPAIIAVDEVPDGWGLYYYNGKRFTKVKESGFFKADMRTERAIIAHALRKYASGDQSNILIRTYDYMERT